MNPQNKIFLFFLVFSCLPSSGIAGSFTDYSIYYPEIELAFQPGNSTDKTLSDHKFSKISDERVLVASAPGDGASPEFKSPQKAFLFSAIVPGTGELYGKARRGIIFTAAEIGLWIAYFVTHGQADDTQDDYINFVDEHIVFEKDSLANSTEKWTLEDYEHATQADNWHYVYTETNGKPVERVGKFYWADLPKDMIDQPGGVPLSQSNSPFRVQAFDKRSSANDKFKQAKVFLGLVVLNHIVSAVDARIATTVYNKGISEKEKVSFHPTISSSGLICLALHRSF